jgi:hypothetical protein
MHYLGDQMPPGTVYGTRSKLIHTEGVIATVKLTDSGEHPFTGIFKNGDHGVVRMSCATKPDIAVKNLTPGIGLKFLRDGAESASLVSMFSVAGQDTWNYFANDFSNHIPAAPLSLQPLAAKFATATDYVQAVGLSDWATIDQNGA